MKDHAFHNYLRSYSFKSNVAFKTQRSGELVNFLRQTIGGVIRQIQEEERSNVRAQLAVNAIFSREDEEDRTVPLLLYMERFYRGGDIDIEIDKCITKINESTGKYAENGSGYSLTGIQSLDIHIAKFDGDFPIPVSQKGPSVPQALATKRRILQIQFEQGLQCFKWSVLAPGHQVLKNNSSQSNLLELNRNGLEGSHGEPGICPTVTFNCFEGKWPIKFNDISKWEKENTSASVGIYVLHYNELEKAICPIRAPYNSNVKY